MFRWIALINVLAMSAAVVGLNCGEADKAAEPAMAVSEKQRVTSPQVDAQDLATQVQANNAFALDLYQHTASGGKNYFASPHSISTALAMTYAGASGETEKEMAEVLRYVLSQDKLHPVFNKLDLELSSRGQGAQGSDGEAFELAVANSLWGRPDGTYLPSFLDLMAENYGAGIRLVDFGNDPEGARKTINQWVADRTRDRIQELLKQGDIDSYTAMVLVNAIYFNAAWLEPFDELNTMAANFDANGSTVSVDMMSDLKKKARYGEGQGYQALEMPFDGEELSMLLLVPEAGSFDSFRQSLSAQTIEDALGLLSNQHVQLKLPRFSFSHHQSLRPALENMGMNRSFDPMAANFEGICGVAGGNAGMVIKDVIHEAFVQVNEKGAEAAGATAVVMADSGVSYNPTEPIQLTVDRPFVFVIRDNATGVILFVGHIVDPNA